MPYTPTGAPNYGSDPRLGRLVPLIWREFQRIALDLGNVQDTVRRAIENPTTSINLTGASVFTVTNGLAGGVIGVNGIAATNSSGTPTFSVNFQTGAVTLSGTVTASAGNIGGFTIGSTTLTSSSGGNTTIVSSGATAFSAGPTGSPTFTVTQAGAVTANNITISSSYSGPLGDYGPIDVTATQNGNWAIKGTTTHSSGGTGIYGLATGNNSSSLGVYARATQANGLPLAVVNAAFSSGTTIASFNAQGSGGLVKFGANAILDSSVATGTAPFNIASTTRVSNLNVATAGTADAVTNGGALNTPASGTLTNCTFPTLNQNTTGSAATLTTARNIGGTSFNGSASIDPIQVKHAGDNSICSFAGSPGATTYPLVYTVGKTASGGGVPALNRNADDGGTMAWYWLKVWSGSQFIYTPYMA